MGPLAHARRIEAMEAFMDGRLAQGGQVVLGGTRVKGSAASSSRQPS